MRILTLIVIFFWILIQGEFLVMKIAEVGIIHKWAWVKVFSPTFVLLAIGLLVLWIESWVEAIKEFRSVKKKSL